MSTATTVVQKVMFPKSRQQYSLYPVFDEVPIDKIPWNIPAPDYAPKWGFTHSDVITNDETTDPNNKKLWAHPLDVTKIRTPIAMSHTGNLQYDGQGRPLFPGGRTGKNTRGLLGKFGPNHAADPLVTRYNHRDGRLQVVRVRRRDNNQRALPGGMVDPTDGHNSMTCSNAFKTEAEKIATMTTQREFGEEAMNHQGEKKAHQDEIMKKIFANSEVIFKGIVDDPRNSDHAWMETIVVHYHCPDDLADQIKLAAGDDAATAGWTYIDNPALYEDFYASHKEFIDIVAKKMPLMNPKFVSASL